MANPRHRGWKWNPTNTTLDLHVNGTRASTFSPYGARLKHYMTVTDYDSQNATYLAAAILGGIIVHTSATGAGTGTTDTAANIISGCDLTENGQAVVCYLINDGDQTVTLAGGTDVTVGDTGQTIATNESALLIFLRTAATTVTMYHVGA